MKTIQSSRKEIIQYALDEQERSGIPAFSDGDYIYTPVYDCKGCEGRYNNENGGAL